MRIPILRNVPIVGTSHRTAEARDLLSTAEEGEVLEIRHEADNAADPFAAAVFLGNVHVGYIPAVSSAAPCVMLGMGLRLQSALGGEPGTRRTATVYVCNADEHA